MTNDMQRLEEAYRTERESAMLYSMLSVAERDSATKATLKEMAAEEQMHAVHWAAQLTQAGHPIPEVRLSLRSRVLLGLATRFGTSSIASFLTMEERQGVKSYSANRANRSFAGEERDHARVFAKLAADDTDVAGAEGWHRSGAVNLRAAIFGLNDGLVSNLSLVVGVAGAHTTPDLVLLTGVAGLLAGAFSMAGGEFISVQSQREVLERQLEIERIELEESPEDEARELTRIYRRKGIPEADAQRLARTVLADPETALDTLAREELGLNPQDLGSPTWAAGSSFVSFAFGAVIPIVPYLLMRSEQALGVSVGASALALFAMGALLALLSGRSPLTSGLRMLSVGACAAGITFAVGRMLGVAIGG